MELQRKAAGPGELKTVPSIVHEVLRSPGQPLDPTARAFFEPRLGHDFGQVRVHADARAAESARAVNALAYTVGRDVVFATGRQSIHTQAGQKLLAHELTHVLQQAEVSSIPQNLDMVSHPSDPLEKGADAVADVISGGKSGSKELRRNSTTSSLGQGVSAARVMRTISYDADCAPHQEEVEGNVSRAQASAGRWARAALTSLAIPEDVGSLLRRHFNVAATNTAALTQIRSAFEAIAGHLESDAFTYHCRPGSDPRCRLPDGPYAGFASAGGFNINFCDPYPYQNFIGHKSLIDTLLHEAAHAHNTAFDHDTYEWHRNYPGPNPLSNADSYASFARDAALGFGGPSLEVSLGSLVAAEPQFYIAAGVSGEIGGPVLDVFNLKFGLRTAFMPETARQPARWVATAADIGLRINPIRERVYVDLTTGAFYGLNFRDTEVMAGIANRITAGYRGENVDLGLDLSHFYDLVGDENLVIVGVRGAIRFP